MGLNLGGLGAPAGCPKVQSFVNAASRALLTSTLVPDCVIAVKGEHFGPHNDQFDPPVNEAFGISLSFSTGDRFPIYSVAPDQIVCVVPGALSAPQAFILEVNVPPPGPAPCPAITLKGRLTASLPGLFTADGTVNGRGLFFTYPDGNDQPIPAGPEGNPTLVQVYGTGMRHAGAMPSAFIDGVAVAVNASEADTTRPGYDRLVFQLPAGLGPGIHQFKVAADGQESNEVQIELA